MIEAHVEVVKPHASTDALLAGRLPSGDYSDYAIAVLRAVGNSGYIVLALRQYEQTVQIKSTQRIVVSAVRGITGDVNTALEHIGLSAVIARRTLIRILEAVRKAERT